MSEVDEYSIISHACLAFFVFCFNWPRFIILHLWDVLCNPVLFSSVIGSDPTGHIEGRIPCITFFIFKLTRGSCEHWKAFAIVGYLNSFAIWINRSLHTQSLVGLSMSIFWDIKLLVFARWILNKEFWESTHFLLNASLIVIYPIEEEEWHK